jgi:hypothetical protein
MVPRDRITATANTTSPRVIQYTGNEWNDEFECDFDSGFCCKRIRCGPGQANRIISCLLLCDGCFEYSARKCLGVFGLAVCACRVTDSVLFSLALLWVCSACPRCQLWTTISSKPLALKNTTLRINQQNADRDTAAGARADETYVVVLALVSAVLHVEPSSPIPASHACLNGVYCACMNHYTVQPRNAGGSCHHAMWSSLLPVCARFSQPGNVYGDTG